MIWWTLLSLMAQAEDNTHGSPSTTHAATSAHTDTHPSVADAHGNTHRAIGLKLIDLNALHAGGEVSAWVGAGIIVELPLSRTVIVELAGQALFGLPAHPGVALPLDALVKRVWLRKRWVVTAGGGPSLTWMRVPHGTALFPGVLTSLGGSYWFGEHLKWGVLAEVDVGAALEHGAIVPELEFATGIVFAF